jgi:uncharacterized protein (DUF1810 family)
MPRMTIDDHDLERFVRAQGGGVYQGALAELRAGRKVTHWIWFVFPQIAGLGRSEMAQRYAITSLEEARAFLSHSVLGARLREAASALLEVQGSSATDILGEIDAAKLRSSMTLFARADPAEPVFGAVLTRFFDGQEDPATIERLV